MTHVAITNNEAPTRIDGVVQQATGVSGGETQWPLEQSYRRDPGRGVVFQENWRGFRTWDTWEVEFFPPQRRQVEYNNAGTMQNVLAARNAPLPTSPAPIPIGAYAVNQSQVNTGYGSGGRDWRDNVRRR